MKDRQGVMRGKCNSCDECEEYIAPKEGARCEYCNHAPVEHVKIIKLGGCKKCGEDCTEYVSGRETCYTDCEYCGCKANEHQGAEKRKHDLYMYKCRHTGAHVEQSILIFHVNKQV